MSVSVAIIEDNKEIRESLALLIGGSAGYTCVKVFADAETAVDELPKLSVNVVLVDIHLPGITGIEAIKQLKPYCPDTQFMISSAYEDTDLIFEALQSGANGYLIKNTPPVKILEAINEIHNGGSPMSSSIARKVVFSFQQNKTIATNAALEKLSEREKEILNLLAQSQRYKEISAKLFITADTVRCHIQNIYKKLQVQSRTEALNKVFPR